jgi:hypothetical protein
MLACAAVRAERALAVATTVTATPTPVPTPPPPAAGPEVSPGGLAAIIVFAVLFVVAVVAATFYFSKSRALVSAIWRRFF